jgi:serine protease Do
MVKAVLPSIKEKGKPDMGWLGVSAQAVTPDIAAAIGLQDPIGAIINGITKGSPADKAGFKRGDLIIELNGKKIKDSTELRNMVASMAPGTKVPVKIIRDGKEQTISITLGEFQEKKIIKKTESNNVLKGITVQELTQSLRDKLDIPENTNGVVVIGINPDSPAQGLLQVNDVILEVNRQEIRSAQEYEQIVSKISEKDAVLLLIYREGGSAYLTIKP